MKASAEGEEYLNIILLLIHPGLHRVGTSVLEQLRTSSDTKDIADLWTSVYTGIAIISNRKTKSHVDTNGRPEWYDLLLNVGSVAGLSRLEFEDVGLRLAYGPGTVVGGCGQIFSHKVDGWGEGDRVCYAHFMRDKVRERFGLQSGGWACQSMYADHISPSLLEDKSFII